MGALLRESLRAFCAGNQCSYAVFWKVGCQNSRILIWEEYHLESLDNVNERLGVPYERWATSEDSAALLVYHMMNNYQFCMVGEGIVGRAAFTGNHEWFLLNGFIDGTHPPEVVSVINELHHQISAGIKTVVVVPVSSYGVVLLGSFFTIMENPGMINDVRRLVMRHQTESKAVQTSSNSAANRTQNSLLKGYKNDRISDGLNHISIASFSGASPSSGQFVCSSVDELAVSSLLEQYSGDRGPSYSPCDYAHDKVSDSGMIPFGMPVGGISKLPEDYGNCPSVDELYGLVGADEKCRQVDGGFSSLLGCDSNESVTCELPANTNAQYNLLEALVSGAFSFTSAACLSSDPGGKSKIGSSANEMGSCSQLTTWVSCSGNQDSSVGLDKQSDEGSKTSRNKRLKTRDNPRPRPKDRQMIQDRVKELREIVPNGAKCSIDALLERTIKHMLFLQCVAKHADKLKCVRESKLIGNDGSVALKNSAEGGKTWAYEVGSQSTFCPIIVEDLNPPRQMLVEMVCEERGLFLEIAEVIRGMGLSIMRGVMECRGGSIWAQFAVEAERDFTRRELFLLLVHHLEQLKTSTHQNDDVCTSHHHFPW